MYNDASLALIPSAVGDGVVYNARPVEVLGAELVTGLTNGTTYPFDTFTSSGRDVTAAIKTSGFAGCITNGVTFTSGDKVRVRLTYNKTSGNDLRVLFSSSQSGAGVSVSDTQNISESGEVYCTFTMTATGTAYLQLGTGNASHSIDAAMLNISVKEVLTSAQDFDFTRASEATRVLSGGRIEKVRTNSLLQSNDFDTAPFAGTRITLTGGQADKDGGTDAWKLAANTSNGTHYINQSLTISNGIACLSIYAKAGGYSYLTIRDDSSGSSYAKFDLATGVTDYLTSSQAVASSIEPVGDGWYRCSMTFTETAAGNVLFYVASAYDYAGAYAGDGTSGIYIQNAQLEQGLVATEYIATTSTSVSVGSVNDMPRLDWSGGCPSLLLEPQRTQLITQSEFFGGSDWTKNGTSVVSGFTSPEGLSNAYKLVEDSNNAQHFIYSSNSGGSVGNKITTSFFVKADTRSWCRIIGYDGSSVWFDLENGVLGTQTNAIGSIEPLLNDWYKISSTYTSSHASNEKGYLYLATGNNSTSYQGDGTSGVYIYGAQLEVGNFSTSYIPSHGTATTRAADACSKTGISSLIGQTEGTLFLNISALSDDATNRRITLSDGTAINRMYVSYKNYTNQIRIEVISAGVSVYDSTYSSGDITEISKIALAYKANDFAFYINGSQISTDTSGAVPTPLTAFKFEDGAGGNVFFGNVNQALLFTTRLSNTELEKLTTL
jgi:hypothetical protein